jgi:hypothetical protein
MLFPVSKINTDFTATHKLLYGPPKCGKSTFASMMKDEHGRIPLFVATEEGHSSLQVSRVRITTGWEGFIKSIGFLEANKERLVNEHSCIVLDLASDLDAWASSHIANLKKVEYVGDLEMGKGWKILGDHIRDAFSRIMALSPTVLITHMGEKEIKDSTGDKYKQQVPDLSKGANKFLNGKVDTIMYFIPASAKKEFPEITMLPAAGHVAGSRQRDLCRSFKLDPTNTLATYQEMCAIYKAGQEKLVTTGAVEPTAPSLT